MQAWPVPHEFDKATLKLANQKFYEIVKIATKFGFDTCTYNIRMPIPVSRPMVLTFRSYNLSRAYCEPQNCLDPEEPQLPHVTNDQPIDWLPSSAVMLSHVGPDAGCSAPHLKWTHVVRDDCGTIGQLVLTQKIIQAHRGEPSIDHAAIAWMASCTHDQIAKMLLPQLVPETLVLVTPREKEVLRWTAEGKTIYEIAKILLISERTVKFHVDNLVSKMKAVNKTQAVVKAIALGMHL
jgi:LuxR family quorum-sensing system transcriptional regulator SolR